MWLVPELIASFAHLLNWANTQPSEGELSRCVQTFLSSLLALVPCLLCPTSSVLEGSLGHCVLRRDLASRVQILAGIFGHYSNKNNGNLIRSQKICFVFVALVVTTRDMGFGFCHFSFIWKNSRRERMMFHWLCPGMLGEPPLLPLSCLSVFDKGRLIAFFLVCKSCLVCFFPSRKKSDIAL